MFLRARWLPNIVLLLSSYGMLFLLLCAFLILSPVSAQEKYAVESVSASTFQSPNEPSNTLDGSLSSRWSAEGFGQWIQYNLDSPKVVSQVFIAWYKGDKRNAEFEIQISMDASSWTKVFRGASSGKTLGLQPYSFNDVTAKYVRVVGFGNSEKNNRWNSITEVEIHGSSIQDNRLDVETVAASDFQAPNAPSNTTDRNLSTRWSAEGDGQWIWYDLGDIKTISQVFIAWYKGDVRVARFDIQASVDGVDWQQVFNGASSGTSITLQDYDFKDVKARYVRIVGHGSTENGWNSITEVEIHTSEKEAVAQLDIIGVVPDSFSTDGGIFDLSVIFRDEKGSIITSGVTKENFAFRDINASLETKPEDIVTNGNAYVNSIDILQKEEGEQATVVLDFDSSGSMLYNDPKRSRVAAGEQLVSHLKTTDRAAVMDFGVSVTQGFRVSRLLQDFTSDKALLNSAIDKVTERFNGTPLYDSLLDTLDQFAEGTSPTNPAVVVLTDGEDNRSRSTSLDVIQRAQEQSIPIFTVGLGKGAGFPPLQDIARETGGTFVEAVNADELVRLYQVIGVGVVDGRIVVSGSGRFDPPLAEEGTYIVSGVLVTTLGNQTFSTPFSFPVEVQVRSNRGYVVSIDGVHILSIYNPNIPPDFSKYLYDAIDQSWLNRIKNSVGETTAFEWSRNVYDSSVYVNDLSIVLKGLSKIAKKNNAPFVVLSHSWGTVLAYVAIHDNEDIHVDKFVSLGSPLNAQNNTVRDFTKDWLDGWGIRNLEPLPNVNQWTNYWADCDPISGVIGVAKKNIIIDTNMFDNGMRTCHSAFYKDYAEWQQILLDVILTK